MTKEILVRISGLHQELETPNETENEAIEVIVPGTYYYKNGKHYILYEEIEENGKITKNQMKIVADDHIEIRKSGVLTTCITFETGKKHPAVYQTPFGQMHVAMDTRMIGLREEEDAINVEIDYSLEVNQKPLADCRIEINVTSKQGQTN